MNNNFTSEESWKRRAEAHAQERIALIQENKDLEAEVARLRERLKVYEDVSGLSDNELVNRCEHLQTEVVRLREQLEDSVSHETLWATECERNDAEEAAEKLADVCRCLLGSYHEIIRDYDWLEDE